MMEEKEEMAKVFVVGHRNPDTDSICSAISYANLKNTSDDGKNMLPAGQDVSMRRQNMCLTILAYRSQSWLRM